MRPFVPMLLDALHVCFKDESWPVRDGKKRCFCTLSPNLSVNVFRLKGSLYFSFLRGVWQFHFVFSRRIKVSLYFS